MVVRYRLKIPSLWMTVQHHSAQSLFGITQPNIYPRDRIFSWHFTTIKDSYNLFPVGLHFTEKNLSSVWAVKHSFHSEIMKKKNVKG